MKKILGKKCFAASLIASAFVWVLMSACAPRTELVEGDSAEGASRFELIYEGGWYPMEMDGVEQWRWAKSPAVIRLFANTDLREARFHTEIRGAAEQNLAVLFNGTRVRDLRLTEGSFQGLNLGLSLREGENILEFVSDQAGTVFEGDGRELGFLLKNDSCTVRKDEEAFEVGYADGWYGLETVGADRWRWSSGSGSLEAVNILSEAKKVRLLCHVRTIVAREIVVSMNGEQVSTIQLAEGGDLSTELELVLQPGASRIEFSSAVAATKVAGDTRELSFCLYEPSLAGEAR